MRNNQDSYIRQSDYCHKYGKKGVKLNESRLKYITTKTYTPNTIFASIFSFRLISRATFKVGSHLPDI